MIVAIFLLLLFLGVPIIFVMGVSAMIYIWATGMSLIALPQRMWVGMDSFVLLAIPFYVLMGNIMTAGEVTDKLVNFAKLFVGRISGGLAHVNILVSVIFAGISGSANADVAAIGGIMIPAMARDGYHKDFATAVTVSSACISPIIPPSIVFVVYAVVAEQSIAAMFLAGVVPGLILAGLQMVTVLYFAKRRGYQRDTGPMPSFRVFVKVTLDGFWILIAPGIILFGILTGAFTPTEAGAMAAVYTLVIAFGYKRLKVRQLPKILFDTVLITASAYFLVAMASAFAWILTIELVPQTVTATITTLSDNPILILLLINLLLLFVGTFMEALSALIVLVPVLLPAVVALGVDPVHFGVVVCVNLILGFITPPVGTCLFVGSAIADISIESLSKAVLPFFFASLVGLLIITLAPDLVLWLPRLVGFA